MLISLLPRGERKGEGLLLCSPLPYRYALTARRPSRETPKLRAQWTRR
jgi:hypothetical protein